MEDVDVTMEAMCDLVEHTVQNLREQEGAPTNDNTKRTQ
jgi:hypothetical protein